MIKDAPMPLKVLLLTLFCSVCGLTLVGLIGHETLAFGLAGGVAGLFGVLAVPWRMMQMRGNHD